MCPSSSSLWISRTCLWCFKLPILSFLVSIYFSRLFVIRMIIYSFSLLKVTAKSTRLIILVLFIYVALPLIRANNRRSSINLINFLNVGSRPFRTSHCSLSSVYSTNFVKRKSCKIQLNGFDPRWSNNTRLNRIETSGTLQFYTWMVPKYRFDRQETSFDEGRKFIAEQTGQLAGNLLLNGRGAQLGKYWPPLWILIHRELN